MSNSKTILITRPAYDEATAYLAAWSKRVFETAKNKGIKIIDLRKNNVKRKILEKHLEKNNPQLVVFNGHGTDNLITGYARNHVLIKAGENEKILNGRIACAIACNSAKKLGPKSVQAGAKAFIGFSEEFVFLHEEKRSTTPYKDKIAGYFLGPANLIPISLMKGNTVKEAFKKSQQSFEKSIEYFETHYTPENSHILFWLRYDKEIQKKCGDDNSCI